MFTINQLSFGYNKRTGNLFQDFSLELNAGNVYGLLGKNGAGKSTLIYLMTGLLTPPAGEVLFDGENVRNRLPKTMSDIFLVPEEFELPNLTLQKYVDINATFYPRFSMEDMQRWLTDKRGSKVSLLVPQRGEQAQLCAMCRANAAEALAAEHDSAIDAGVF